MLLYGGIGLRFRKRTYAIIEPVFGKKGSNYFFSILLAAGQIGWFGVISEIGGISFSSIFRISPLAGIVSYSILMILMASLNLHNLGIVKTVITASSITLVAYLFVAKGNVISFNSLIVYQPSSLRSLLWGISAVFASLISFTSVTPDFLSQARAQKDVILTILFGVVLPGFLIGSLGVFLFHDFMTIQMAALISSLSLPLFGKIFNAFTNTDAAVAIYTPGLAFSHIFGIKHWQGILVSGILGCTLAIFGIARNLDQWLTFLSSVYPSIIGLTLAFYFSSKMRDVTSNAKDFEWLSIFVVIFTLLLGIFIDLSFLSWISIVVSFSIAFFFNYVRFRKTNEN
jgi:purine-cytosine permease-like protein